MQSIMSKEQKNFGKAYESKCKRDLFYFRWKWESDNLALIGCARANRRAGNDLITTSIEHPAILNTMRYLEEEEGFRVTYLPVRS